MTEKKKNAAGPILGVCLIYKVSDQRGLTVVVSVF